jgi:hypothetical protein
MLAGEFLAQVVVGVFGGKSGEVVGRVMSVEFGHHPIYIGMGQPNHLLNLGLGLGFSDFYHRRAPLEVLYGDGTGLS